MKKRILSLFLVFAMLFSLSACGSSDETTPSTTVPPTTEPGPDAVELYNAAAETISSAPSMIVDYTIDMEMTVGSDTYLETEKTHLTLTGLGTDAFAASASTDWTWGEAHYADTSDVFIDGNWYGKTNQNSYTAEMTAEDYQSMYLPTVLLTAELYSNVEMLDETTVSFSGATELEPWLAEDGLVLTEASGTAVIGSTGKLEDCTYEATYSYMGVQFHLTVSSRARTGELTVEAPVNPDSYTTTDAPFAALVYERAVGMIFQAGDITSTSSESIFIQAGGAMLTQQSTMNSFGSGKDLMAKFDTSATLMDMNTYTTEYSYIQEELFRDGKYTYSVDGGAAQADPSVDAETIRYYCQIFVPEMIFALENLATLNGTDTGAAYLLEYTLTEDAAKAYTTSLCGSIYEDANLLNSLASAYRTETATGYIGIDKVTGLPLSIGTQYLGIHTIDGTEYNLAYDHSQTISVGTAASYEEIVGEPLPVEAPEEPATPLLYHVTGENGEEMWLFGTIHVGDGRTQHLPQYVTDAFAASDALAVEFDSNQFEKQIEEDAEMLAQLQQYYFYTDGTVTANHISDEELYDAAIKALKATGSYHVNLEMMKPSLLANTIENVYMDLGHALSGAYGVDSRLLAMAEEAGKEILSVESGLFQIGMLTGFSDALQEQLLLEAVASDPLEYQMGTMELYEMWCAGDEAALIEYLAEEDDHSDMTEEEIALYEEYWQAMSDSRNVDMLEVAKGYLNGDTTVFYAVGLAHLLAEDGLVNTLRNAGYTVELVPAA